MAKTKDIAGQRFGRLLVLNFSRVIPGRGAQWLVRCDCGTEKESSGVQLRYGKINSCGCSRMESYLKTCKERPTHRMKGTPTYNSYRAMLARCTDPDHDNYANYGGSGILVCERWLAGFLFFLEDMGVAPDGTTIDRFPDKAGHYEPGNCRWATWTQQANNKRTNRILEHDGLRMTVAEWSQLIAISQSTLNKRMKAGWSVERTLTERLKSYWIETDEGERG